MWAPRRPKVGARHPELPDATAQGGHRAPRPARCDGPRWAPGTPTCTMRRPNVATGHPGLRAATPHRGRRAPRPAPRDAPRGSPGSPTCAMRRPIVVTGQPSAWVATSHRRRRAPRPARCDAPRWAPRTPRRAPLATTGTSPGLRGDPLMAHAGSGPRRPPGGFQRGAVARWRAALPCAAPSPRAGPPWRGIQGAAQAPWPRGSGGGARPRRHVTRRRRAQRRPSTTRPPPKTTETPRNAPRGPRGLSRRRSRPSRARRDPAAQRGGAARGPRRSPKGTGSGAHPTPGPMQGQRLRALRRRDPWRERPKQVILARLSSGAPGALERRWVRGSTDRPGEGA
ncbi:MAG: hypothetical protein RL071_4475 [Pseudomonadota bacterium]